MWKVNILILYQNIIILEFTKQILIQTIRKIYVSGKTELCGTTVKATDLRAGACLILAALVAHGTTTITDVEHVLRGYENIILKLTNVGAKMKLEEI